MQFLVAQQVNNAQGNPVAYAYEVWLDASKGTQSAPDPAYVRDYIYAATVPTAADGSPAYPSQAAWQAQTVAEAKAAAAADLAAIAPDPVVLAVQGTTF